MRRSIVSVVFVVIALCASAAPGGNKTGDVGSVDCRQAQLDAQALVAGHGPFKNHGQLMQAVNKFLNQEIHGRVITGRCAACIREQFARRIPPEEQTLCGKDPMQKVVERFAVERFEKIRELIDPGDATASSTRFVGQHVEVASDAWVYVLDFAGKQVFRPKAAAPHMSEAFAVEIGPDVDTWALERVPPSMVSLAQEVAFEIFQAKYVFDPATSVVPVRELITSKAVEWEMVKSHQGRTSVLFRPSHLDNDLVESFRTTVTTSPDGEPIVRTQELEVPSRSYETAVTFAPAGHVMRVESGFLTSEAREVLGVFQQALAERLIDSEQVLYDQTLRFGGFFSPEEPRLELTAFSYEGEDFLDLHPPNCVDPATCNPFWPFESYSYCYNSPHTPHVNLEIRPSRQYRFNTFNTWRDYGRRNGIRGNWDREAGEWEIPNAVIEVHRSLRDYDTLFDPSYIKFIMVCKDHEEEDVFPFWHSEGNKLLQPFYDDLERCHVAMINTHGGPGESARSGRITFQFMRNYDEWVTLHEEFDDGLGVGRLRHLFLETCSSINWRNNYKDHPKTLATDFMNSHVADGVRTIAGFDGGRFGGQVTGWRFFGHYHAGESISQAWFATGLEEYECNMPIIVAYGETEEEAASILFDGRFSTRRSGTGWAVASEPLTEEHLEPRACCLYGAVGGPSCVELSHSDCEAFGGAPMDCGTSCSDEDFSCE